MIRRPPRSTLDRSSAASDVYKRQGQLCSGGKRQKTRSNTKNIGERSKPSDGLGRGKGRHPSPFHLPRLPYLFFAHSDFFFLFPPTRSLVPGYYYNAIVFLILIYRDLYLVGIPVQRLNNRGLMFVLVGTNPELISFLTGAFVVLTPGYISDEPLFPIADGFGGELFCALLGLSLIHISEPTRPY